MGLSHATECIVTPFLSNMLRRKQQPILDWNVCNTTETGYVQKKRTPTVAV